MDNNPRFTRRQVIIGAVAGAAVIGLILLFFFTRPAEESSSVRVTIGGLDSCSKNIDPMYADSLDLVYNYIENSNEYNGWETADEYTSSIRAGTCSQEQHLDQATNNNYYATTFIVDIPDAGQSYRVSYAWTAKGVRVDADLGYPVVSCLPLEELIYGDFHCSEMPFAKKNHIEPVLSIIPYYSLFYEIRPVDIGDGVIKLHITIMPSAGEARGDIDAAIAQHKQSASDYLVANAINPSSYEIEYEIVYPSVY